MSNLWTKLINKNQIQVLAHVAMMHVSNTSNLIKFIFSGYVLIFNIIIYNRRRPLKL